jgi:hypothetical protein
MIHNRFRRRTLAAFTLAAAVLLTVFQENLPAQTNNSQRVYPVGSELYAGIRALYITRGLALPSTTAPWSAAELLMMLDRLDTAAMTSGETELYDQLTESLRPPGQIFIVHIDPSLETHTHTNPDDFSRPYQFNRLINTMRPLLGLGGELFFTDHAYLYFEWPVSARIYYEDSDTPRDNYPPSPQVGRSYFGANIPFLAGSKDLDANIPYRAFFALGGRRWNAVFGRDRLSWGPGESGNFVVGDQVQYHNNLRASFYNSRFKYTYSISSFAYPGEYYLGWDKSQSDYTTPVNWSGVRTDNGDFMVKGLSLFIAHRGELRFFENRLNIVVTEAIRYQSRSGTIGFEQLFPVMLLHNLYRSDNQNSILSLEGDFAVYPRFNIYAQIAFDEFALPGAEGSPSATSAENPNALGFMLGLKTVVPFKNGILQGSFEGAYTMPYLYLVEEADGFNSNSYVTANRYYNGSGYALFVEEFLGYRWGGDALVFNLNASYTRLARWNAKFNMMFMLHGTHDRWTKWEKVYSSGSGQPYTNNFLTSSHPNTNYADDAGAKQRNALSATLIPSLSGSFFIRPDWEVYGQADFIAAINHGNIRHNFAADFQLTLGMTYRFTHSVPAERHALDR